MSSLHSNAPPHSLEKTLKIIEKAFGGRAFQDIFEEFQTKPLGVGAIAQVYKAKLKPDLVVPGNVDISPTEPTLTETLRQKVDYALKSSPARAPPPSSYVAVKVLHPGVDRTVQRDLRIMAFFAQLLNAIPSIHWLSLPDEVATFGEMMKLQLDLRIEAANLARFRRNFATRTTAWFPFAYAEYSSRSVLVEEFANGVPLEDFLQNGGGPFEKEIADEGLDAFLHMLLIDNFTHADLHPGNIMVRFYRPPKRLDVPSLLHSPQRRYPKAARAKSLDTAIDGDDGDNEDGHDATDEVLARLKPLRRQRGPWAEELQRLHAEGFQPQLIFIDTGLVTELNAENRRNFLELFKAVAEFDGYKAGQLMVERCRQPDAVLDREVFALRMQHLVLGVKSKTFALGNIKIGDILNEVLNMVRTHHVRLEGDFVNVVLSILLLEGIGRSLDPEMDLFAG
jgi:aarF domain-containing kinase